MVRFCGHHSEASRLVSLFGSKSKHTDLDWTWPGRLVYHQDLDEKDAESQAHGSIDMFDMEVNVSSRVEDTLGSLIFDL